MPAAWESWFKEHYKAGASAASLTTGSGIAAPKALSLKWSARNVSLANKFDLPVPVLVDAGSEVKVRFRFSSVGGDLCFAAHFLDQGSDEFYVKELRTRTREQCHVAAVEGEITVKNSGTLRLTWDNGGAPWRKVRHLDYFVNVYQPGADTLVHEARSKSRNSLKVVGASRHVLGNRSVQLATFLDNCTEEEAVLELQAAEIAQALARVRIAKSAALSAERAVIHESEQLKRKTVETVLGLVLRDGWLA